MKSLEPQRAHDLIRAACLRRPELSYWQSDRKVYEFLNQHGIAPNKPKNYRGFCYIASQVFAYLTGAEVWATDTGEHYWNVLNGSIWDLTKEQFSEPFDYLNFTHNHKVPRKKKLTARAKELLIELENEKL